MTRASDPLAGLPPADRDRLSAAIGRIEDEVYRAVLRRVVRVALIAAAGFVVAVTAIGWASWSALRGRLAEEALRSLQADEALQSDLLASLGIDTTLANARLRATLAQLDTLARRGGTSGGTGTTTDPEMAEIQRMLDELLRDFRTELNR